MTSSPILFETPSALKFDPKAAFLVPLGAVSPFWLMYAGAASAGMAYWWFSRWRDTTNVEAMFAPTAVVEAVEQATALVLEAPIPEPVEPEVVIPVAELVAEPPTPEPAEALALEPEPAPEVEPEPVLEAAADPVIEPPPAKPKLKAARAAKPISDNIGPA